MRTRWGLVTAGVVVLSMLVPVSTTSASVLQQAPLATDTSDTPSRRADLDERVRANLLSDGHVDAIVNLDGTRALANAQTAVRTLAPRDQGAELLAHTVPAYTAMKQDALGDVEVLATYDALPTALVRFNSEEELRAVLSDPSVTSVRADRVRSTSLAQSLPLVKQPAAASAGYTGAGTAVAVIDTGVDYSRAAFGSCSAPGGSCKVAYAQDFAPSDGQRDADGHGSNVAGIVLGVAPSTKILALDVFQGSGAKDSTIIAAIDWVITTKSSYGTRSVNMSLGDSSWHTTECTTSSYTAPFANLRAAGVLPVVAAGNDGYIARTFHDGVSAPACATGAIRVGAVYDASLGGINWGDCNDSTTAADKIACFSQTGTLLTLWAPGSQITAAGTTYSGTSQATPHVAGAVAVVGAAAPSASVTSLQNALSTTGPTITDSRNGVVKRRLDVMAAVTAVRGSTPTPTPTPTPSPTPGPGITTTSGTPSGYYSKAGSTYLYRYRKNVTFTGQLTPALTGQQLQVEWQQRTGSSWVTIDDVGLAQDGSGKVSLSIDDSDLSRGIRYRLRAYYRGDATHIASTSGYSQFKMTT